ncbi:tannase/feruloyl esterase family alpha/beta hydrolase [Nonomuraea sp. NPDC050547]|uniref:tannase/feruloyl esterase family alpha/beta hydrolase n=1 Tax=Nonomuraea sp. NPDC050547 TaxID=3364368 RepID=UPI00379F68B6
MRRPSRTKVGIISCLPLAAALVAVGDPVRADAGRCAALMNATVTDTTITRATTVTATTSVPEHCLVDAYVTTPGDATVPSNRVNFRLGLPAAWNSDFYFQGVGGLAGHIVPFDEGLRRGYASAATDTGHQGASPLGHPELDGRWALGNRPKQIDYAYRGVHVSTVAAKAITAIHYGRDTRKAIFNGCSNGGRQGLMEVQRYPADYDGVIAEGPAFAAGDTFLRWISQAQAQLATSGSWLSPSTLPILSAESLKRGDARDGLTDGLVADPRKAAVNPGRLIGPGKLTRAQAAAARTIYRGPGPLRGHPAGHEELWRSYITGSAPPQMGPDGKLVFPFSLAAPLSYTFANEFLRYFLFSDPSYDLTRFDLAKDRPAVERIRALLDATDPDLTAYRARGGKLLMVHGWSDPALSGTAPVAYHRKVVAEMGAARTAGFFRLFMAPGMGHCAGGPGPNTFDALTAMEQWINRGTAPASILATHPASGRSRPLCPYPAVALYKGSGSIEDAANFTCGSPHDAH